MAANVTLVKQDIVYIDNLFLITCSRLVSLVLLWISEEMRVNPCLSTNMRSNRTRVRLPHFPTLLYTTWLGNGRACNIQSISTKEQSTYWHKHICICRHTNEIQALKYYYDMQCSYSGC